MEKVKTDLTSGGRRVSPASRRYKANIRLLLAGSAASCGLKKARNAWEVQE